MDAKQAMMRVDELMGEFSGNVHKIAFCRQMIEDAANGGGGLERMGENNLYGLACILSDLEGGYHQLKAEVRGLFDEAHGVDRENATEMEVRA